MDWETVGEGVGAELTGVVGEDEVVETRGERLTKTARSPGRRPPVDGRLGEEAELVARWTERQTLMKAVAPEEPMWSVKMRWWGPKARG